MLIKTENPMAVAKRAFFLAWRACGEPQGMGVFQDNPLATEDAVWESVTGKKLTDYTMDMLNGSAVRPHADYVFGRMMKLGIKVKADGLEVYDDKPRLDYQAWCRVYKTYEDLILAAISSLAQGK